VSDVRERFTIALHNASRSWRQAVDRRLKVFKISQVTWLTISIAAKAQAPLSQTELADQLGVEDATTVATLDRLVKVGLIVRKACEHDRRVKHVVLTAAGRELYDKVKAEALGKLCIGDCRRTLHRV